jgi:hypothetical protein
MRFDHEGRVADPALLRGKKSSNPSDGSAKSEGRVLVESMLGRAPTSMSTDELMKLLREE